MDGSWLNCNQCGYRFGAWIASCPNCGAANSTRKSASKIGKGKKIAISAIIAVVAFLAVTIGINSLTSHDETNAAQAINTESNFQKASTEDHQPQIPLVTDNSNSLFRGSVLSLYPTRDEVGTEWVIDNPEQVFSNGSINQDYFKCDNCVLPDVNRLGEPGELDGLVEAGAGTYMDYSRVMLVILKFDSHENAYQPYHSKVQALYEEGGFEQVDVSSITGAECFGTQPSIHGIRSGLYCVKGNVVFYIHNNWTYDEEANLTFAKMVADKIK